jgi:hypothetical protein
MKREIKKDWIACRLEMSRERKLKTFLHLLLKILVIKSPLFAFGNVTAKKLSRLRQTPLGSCISRAPPNVNSSSHAAH